ncbi:MAG: methyltransferase domain-containing protein [Pseudomonadota bacterium]
MSAAAQSSDQYANSENLARRAGLHQAYGRVSWFDWLAERMELGPGARVLDVGCGPGWFWRRTAPRAPEGLRLSLLDCSAGMVAEAEAALAGAPFADLRGIVGDAAALPFPDASVDAVLLMHVLYHVADPGRALDEACRVLRPGGRVFVTTNATENLKVIMALAAKTFGTSPVDPGADAFSLDDAVAGLNTRFVDVVRHDLIETYACTDADIVLDFLRSMPPAKDADPADQKRLTEGVKAAFVAAGGILQAQKQTGLVLGTRPPTDI